MNLKQLEDQALHLSEAERAELAQKLILSLDASNAENVDEQWLVAAQSRAKELDNGSVQPISADEVRAKALALLR